MTTLYRADGETCYTGVKSCWTPQCDAALAYTDNQGFGGAILWTAEVADDRVLDLSGLRVADLWDRVADLVADISPDADWAEELRDAWRIADTRYPWEWERRIIPLLAQEWDWVVYDDDYPTDCVTWAHLTSDALDARRV